MHFVLISRHAFLWLSELAHQPLNRPTLPQRATDVEAQLFDEQAKTMRLEVTNAELQQRLSKMDELEKELEHHRYDALPVTTSQ